VARVWRWSTGCRRGHGTGFADVSSFLGAGLLPEDRRAFERDVLAGYLGALRGYGVVVDPDEAWRRDRWCAASGVVMAVVASQIDGTSERSVPMFTAMAERHSRHALDMGTLDLVDGRS
jgi:hypothetical protein